MVVFVFDGLDHGNRVPAFSQDDQFDRCGDRRDFNERETKYAPSTIVGATIPPPMTSRLAAG
jgi:hypothetical protein